ncbi:MAG: endonuclease domain-containing protein, partial [Clostridia bacterium]|nr:endonuclease domain-containing protein [Clostridia bacterium]
MNKLTRNSQTLRKNMTKEERKLWYEYLKLLSVTFYRQKVIGEYIVDFYCDKYKIIIEIDGSQHYEDDAREKDEKRDQYLKKQGNTVLRYSNIDINQRFKYVCEDISKYMI